MLKKGVLVSIYFTVQESSFLSTLTQNTVLFTLLFFFYNWDFLIIRLIDVVSVLLLILDVDNSYLLSLFFFLTTMARGLSSLLIFSKNLLLVFLIYSIVFLFAISLIYALIFIYFFC